MNKLQYQEYLKSDHWKNLRKEYYKVYERRCVECGKTNDLNLHHLTYERIGKERIDDLVCLCHDCHIKLHNKLDKPKKRRNTRKRNNFHMYRVRIVDTLNLIIIVTRKIELHPMQVVEKLIADTL